MSAINTASAVLAGLRLCGIFARPLMERGVVLVASRGGPCYARHLSRADEFVSEIVIEWKNTEQISISYDWSSCNDNFVSVPLQVLSSFEQTTT